MLGKEENIWTGAGSIMGWKRDHHAYSLEAAKVVLGKNLSERYTSVVTCPNGLGFFLVSSLL